MARSESETKSVKRKMRKRVGILDISQPFKPWASPGYASVTAGGKCVGGRGESGQTSRDSQSACSPPLKEPVSFRRFTLLCERA